ncbi:hypothetical protein ESCO_001359 [Escovopsis weberi]|uniref:DUF7136 domain-containing protein n=1 Tax=Escovopsis weberi TaxID=150374 RepID=A0A0M9VUB8_ESCWE|nr:hypothetical protein ESCO_001359 [Escovopsis weberi]
MHNLLRLLISLACRCHLARGEPVDPSKRNSTGILEVDVIFPQNDIWPSSGGDGGYVHTQRLSADELAWDDPHFAYTGYEGFVVRPRSQWILTWSFSWTGCLPEHRGEDGELVPVQANSSSVVGGQVTFTIDSSLGKKLDIAKALTSVTGAASAGGNALCVSETLPAPDNTTFGWARCAVAANTTEVRDPSPVTIDRAAAESISSNLEKRYCAVAMASNTTY